MVVNTSQSPCPATALCRGESRETEGEMIRRCSSSQHLHFPAGCRRGVEVPAHAVPAPGCVSELARLRWGHTSTSLPQRLCQPILRFGCCLGGEGGTLPQWADKDGFLVPASTSQTGLTLRPGMGRAGMGLLNQVDGLKERDGHPHCWRWGGPSGCPLGITPRETGGDNSHDGKGGGEQLEPVISGTRAGLAGLACQHRADSSLCWTLMRVMGDLRGTSPREALPTCPVPPCPFLAASCGFLLCPRSIRQCVSSACMVPGAS